MEPASNLLLIRLKQVPELKPYLRRIALKWAKGVPLPARMTLGPEPKEPAIRNALDRIFGGRLFTHGGKLTVEIPQALREDAVLAPLAEAMGIKRMVEKSVPDPSTIFQRLRLINPHLDAIHAWLRTAPEIERLANDRTGRESPLQPLLQTADFLRTCKTPVTLSALGSTFFNDSKILRSGTLRKVLGGIMNAQTGTEDTPANREIALQQFNVIDNPITTLITLFGPVTLLRNGQKETWVADRFVKGEPVTLNSCNLRQVDGIQLPPAYNTVITSENAAPFHELIAEPHNAVIIYTEGYPNAEVRRLLHLLAQAGTTCLHWGDTDPDGLRIAAIINDMIPTTLYRCALIDMQNNLQRLKHLDGAKQASARRMLSDLSNFTFRPELEFVSTHGWLEQESTMH